MRKIHFTITILLGLLAGYADAQELGVQFMDESVRTGSSNPGQMREHFISIGLPAFHGNYGYNGPTLGGMLKKDANGQYIIDVDAGLAQLKDDNFARLELGLETFNVDLRLGKWQIGLAHAVRFGTGLSFPRELPEMAFNGNSQYIDQNVEVGPDFRLDLYAEWAAGIAYQATDKLSVGGRVKYLSGLGNLSTDQHSIKIHTDPEYYQITATTDYQLNAAGSAFIADIRTDADSVGFDFQNVGVPFGEYLGGGNAGFALDLGVVYEVNDKLTVGASILDMGSIRWGKNASNFRSQGSYTFEGLDASETFFGDDSLNFEPVLDTLVQLLGVTTSNDAYSRGLPTRFYINGSYEIIESLEVGATFHGEARQGRFLPAFAVGVQKEFGEKYQVGATLGYRNKRMDSFGVNFSAQFGPVQLYGATDNLPSVFVPYRSKNTNFRVGLNILLNKKEGGVE